MAEDFISAHDQAMPNTPEEPLSPIEPKGQTTDLLSSDASFCPVSEKFPSPEDIHVPVYQSQEDEANTSDANVSDSDWETINEDKSEERSDDDSTSEETSEDENASRSKHFRPSWDHLLPLMWDNMDPDSFIPAQFLRAMGKMYQKHGKFELAEPLLRMAQHELDRIAGRLHEYTLDTVFSLAAVLSHLGKLDEAGTLARRAIRGYLKVKGPENATTLRVLREISCAYSAVCRQLLQHDPPTDSEERRQVSRHTDMYISICQELPLSAVSVMLGGLGSVLVLTGHTANANLAFQWKYDLLAQLSHRGPPGFNHNREHISPDQFNAWLQDAAKEVQGTNAGLLPPDPFLIGTEETPAEALSTYVMGCVTTEMMRAFMGFHLSPEHELSRLDKQGITSRFETWIEDLVKNIPIASLDPSILADPIAETISALFGGHLLVKIIQDEYVWKLLEEQLWKYNPNYPPNQQEVPSVEGFTAMLMAKARTAKETTPKESSPPTTSFVVTSDSVYDTLPLNEGGTLIRLLELLPGDTAEPPVCNLVVKNMLDTPVYEAVSYTWGVDASLTHEAAVQVNNVRLQVTPNLYACLLALRHRDAPRMLWVDAICINQRDDYEKSEQVARMASIYSSASNVLVYLGDGGEADEALFRYFNRERKEEESFEASLNRLGLSKLEILKPFAALCRREWWTRIWIQQEFALSPTDPTFCLGHLRAKASPLILDVRNTLTKEAMESESLSDDGRWSLGLKLAQHIRQVIRTLDMRPWFEDGPKNLNTVLSMTPQSKCSDPRDFIFGRYVFMKSTLRAVFKPDYSLTAESLFEMVAIWFLKIEIGMELFWLYPRRLSSKSPSWVPDFTKRVSDMESPFPLEDRGEWRAEGQADDPLDIDCGVLKVHARPLDTISHVFRVGNAALPELAGQIMFLEQSLLVIAEQDPPHRCHFLSGVLPGLKARFRPREWALGNDPSIDESLPRNEVFLATVEAANFFKSQFQDSCDRFLGILSHLEHNTLLAHHDSGMRKLRREFTKASAEFAKSFLNFHLLLQREHFTELFWASLCDSRNLIAQIQDLKTPRQPSSPPSWARRHVTDLVNRMIKEMRVPDDPSPVAAENDDTERLFPPSSPNYEELQAAIADCEFEEEVQLRARLVVHLVKLFKSPTDADGIWILPRAQLHGQFADGEEDDPVFRKVRGMRKDWHERFRNEAMQFPHRTIFITEQRLVGVGRTGVTDIRVGDELIMLENGVFPMVIRPRDLGFHEIVGYADIHGLDGQAFHRLDQGQKPPRRVFKFR